MTKKKDEKDYTQFTRWCVNKVLQSTKVQMFIVSNRPENRPGFPKE